MITLYRAGAECESEGGREEWRTILGPVTGGLGSSPFVEVLVTTLRGDRRQLGGTHQHATPTEHRERREQGPDEQRETNEEGGDEGKGGRRRAARG
jgi:hypothetical protein